ncbi:hypothetical protein SPBRAN_1316 [uncultured Candidatus Thioglobus sp.]|nr:hypothetical protein SPBRAN_1316 [uncultured Candidatus Thioglobus sp.]
MVIAGPNGSGKTTITEKLLNHPWAKNAIYVNPDIIANEQFGGWNNKASFIKAANYAEELRQNYIKNKQNPIFETVFSTDGKIEFIKQAMGAGYFVRLFFIATLESAINIKRVEIRVKKGGHTVPMDKIITRYYKSILNCIEVINLMDRVYIYDNFVDDQSPKIMFRIKNSVNNRSIKLYENLSNWTLDIAYCHNLSLAK